MKISWLAITLAGWNIVVSAAGPAPDDTAVDQILNRHIAAAGGRERLASIQSETLTFEMEQAGAVFELTVSFKSGEKTLLEATSAHGWKVKQGQAAPGARWRKSPDELTDRPKPEDLLEFRELALCLSATAVLELRQHFPVLRLLGTERTGSKDCQVVEASMGRDLGVKLWFGQKSGLLEKAGIAMLEDYQPEQGVMVPHTVVRSDNTVLKLKSVVFNESISDKVFEKPKESVPGPAGRQTAQPDDVKALGPASGL